MPVTDKHPAVRPEEAFNCKGISQTAAPELGAWFPDNPPKCLSAVAFYGEVKTPRDRTNKMWQSHRVSAAIPHEKSFKNFSPPANPLRADHQEKVPGWEESQASPAGALPYSRYEHAVSGLTIILLDGSSHHLQDHFCKLVRQWYEGLDSSHTCGIPEQRKKQFLFENFGLLCCISFSSSSENQ